jgi:SPRY domain-containing SOCS box protein 1/4
MWEIKWISNQRGTHACVGVATRKAPIRKTGYCSLIGNSEYSWGWDLGRNVLKHGDQQVAPAFLSTESQENHNKLSYPPMDDMRFLNTGWLQNCFECFNWLRRSFKDTSYIVPSTFQCVLDMDAGTLGFVADGQWLGTAFKGLRGKGAIYPTVSCVWGHCEVTMKYINGLASAPLSLKELSRRVIRSTLPNTNFESIRPIRLPIPLKQYIRDYGLKYHVRLNDNNDKGVNFNDVDTVDAVNDYETYTIEDSFDSDDEL